MLGLGNKEVAEGARGGTLHRDGAGDFAFVTSRQSAIHLLLPTVLDVKRNSLPSWSS